jgi:hypothetical protein
MVNIKAATPVATDNLKANGLDSPNPRTYGSTMSAIATG